MKYNQYTPRGIPIVYIWSDVGHAEKVPGSLPLRHHSTWDGKHQVPRSSLLVPSNAVAASHLPVLLEGVSVRAGSVQILHDLSLEVAAGEAVGVFGANGAGKTTLLRLIATLIKPSAGVATILGSDVGSDERFEIRPRIGYVGHVPGLYPELTLTENLQFVADVRGLAASDVEGALEAVGLGAAGNRLVDRCSHGMQRRAEFARVLMTEPELLLLDEPHSALDGDAVDLVEAIVNKTIGAGGAAVVVSHDQQRVGDMTTRTVEISQGGAR